MNWLDNGQESRRLFFVEAVLSAEKHRLNVQLQKNSLSGFREVNSKHTAQSTVTEENK